MRIRSCGDCFFYSFFVLIRTKLNQSEKNRIEPNQTTDREKKSELENNAGIKIETREANKIKYTLCFVCMFESFFFNFVDAEAEWFPFSQHFLVFLLSLLLTLLPLLLLLLCFNSYHFFAHPFASKRCVHCSICML